jgi:hypothetical protein
MTTKTKESFNLRAFITLMAGFTGAGLPLTGLANHLLQQEPLTVPRHTFMAVHNVLGLVFCVFTICHILLNRRVLAGYIRSGMAQARALKREMIYALALTGAVLVLAVGHGLGLTVP